MFVSSHILTSLIHLISISFSNLYFNLNTNFNIRIFKSDFQHSENIILSLFLKDSRHHELYMLKFFFYNLSPEINLSQIYLSSQINVTSPY